MKTELRAGLVEVAGGLPTFASPGLEEVALRIGAIATDSHDYLAGLLGRRPEAQVLVLSEADWATKCEVPLYGLPNADDDGTLTVAGTEAGWWADFASMVAVEDRAELEAIYGDPDGVLRFAPFFDLVAVHEVGHLFPMGVARFPRLWLGELFANVCLHAWVEERAPSSLPILLTLPRLGARASADQFECRTRDDFETRYGDMSGPNYAWYQFRLQLEAADLVDRRGSAIVRRLMEAFWTQDRPAPAPPHAAEGAAADGAAADGAAAEEPEPLADDALAAVLEDQVDADLARFSLEF